mgnify:CR=1 FL=1
MSLTFTERVEYLRDRIVNAARMLRHRNFRLFAESLIFEINHVRNLFKMWLHSRREAADSDAPDAAFINKAKVLPASWRPTVYRPAPPLTLPEDSDNLAQELKKIRAQLTPREDGERRSKWSRSR